jgi:hypothetical protein
VYVFTCFTFSKHTRPPGAAVRCGKSLASIFYMGVPDFLACTIPRTQLLAHSIREMHKGSLCSLGPQKIVKITTGDHLHHLGYGLHLYSYSCHPRGVGCLAQLSEQCNTYNAHDHLARHPTQWFRSCISKGNQALKLESTPHTLRTSPHTLSSQQASLRPLPLSSQSPGAP